LQSFAPVWLYPIEWQSGGFFSVAALPHSPARPLPSRAIVVKATGKDVARSCRAERLPFSLGAAAGFVSCGDQPEWR